MESCGNQKIVKQIKIYFGFFKVATLCLHDSFLYSWHSLNQLNEECFSNSLEGVPTYAEHFLAAFRSLCGPTHPKPSYWVEVGWLWRPGHLILHSISTFFGQIALTLPGGGFGVTGLLKNSPTMRKPDGVAYCCSMHTITPPPCFAVGTTRAEIIRSPTLRLTMTRQLEPKISILDSSDQITDFHWSNVHCSCFLAQASFLFLLVSFSSGFFAAIWPWRPDSRSLLWTVNLSVTWTLWSIYLGCNFWAW